MTATAGSLYQSVFVGVDAGRLRIGAGGAGYIGAPPASGTIASPLSPQQIGEGPSSPSIGNLSEASEGYTTTIAGRQVHIAYPYS